MGLPRAALPYEGGKSYLHKGSVLPLRLGDVDAGSETCIYHKSQKKIAVTVFGAHYRELPKTCTALDSQHKSAGLHCSFVSISFRVFKRQAKSLFLLHLQAKREFHDIAMLFTALRKHSLQSSPAATGLLEFYQPFQIGDSSAQQFPILGCELQQAQQGSLAALFDAQRRFRLLKELDQALLSRKNHQLLTHRDDAFPYVDGLLFVGCEGSQYKHPDRWTVMTGTQGTSS